MLLWATVSGHRGVAQGQYSMPVMAGPKNSHAHPGTPQPHSLPGCVTASGRKRLESRRGRSPLEAKHGVEEATRHPGEENIFLRLSGAPQRPRRTHPY